MAYWSKTAMSSGNTRHTSADIAAPNSWGTCLQMLYWFKKSGLRTTLADVQQLFFKFRSRGMRLHYWP